MHAPWDGRDPGRDTYVTADVEQETPDQVHGLLPLNQFALAVQPKPFVEVYKSTSADRSSIVQLAYGLLQLTIQFDDHVEDEAGNSAVNPVGIVPVS